MRVVDTSAWIEWLARSSTGLLVDAEIPADTEWLVPTIVQLELAKWLRREVDEKRSEAVLAHSQSCNVWSMDSTIALFAADLSVQYRLATADAVVLATAMASGADLLTCDAHFEGLPNVIYIAKRKN